MKERPILFSGPMVRAILDGRKTQTRRVIKDRAWFANGDVDEQGWPIVECDDGEWRRVRCPYGQPGDRLWVRETWGNISKTGRELYYRADAEAPDCEDYDRREWSWRPSIHMPRWASRIDLEVLAVRVERVQDIDWRDAVAEGIDCPLTSGWDEAKNYPGRKPHALRTFRRLWDSINAKRGFGWAANPWVWAIEFQRCSPEKEQGRAKRK